MSSPINRGLFITIVIFLISCMDPSGHIPERYLNHKSFNSVAIVPVEKALTFARYNNGGAVNLIGVEKYSHGEIFGVNITRASNGRFTDPIDAYQELGYDKLKDFIKESSSLHKLSLKVNKLVLPVDLAEHSIAAGLNYKAHASETGVKNGPFLFPKVVKPTGPYNQVFINEGLLDYEVELAAVTLSPVVDGKLSDNFGLILTNDFTDRAELLKNVDIKNIASGKGFTKAKSFPGFLPVGNLFLIPERAKEFAKDLELSLYVNNSLRQKVNTEEMVLGFEEIISEVWKNKDVNWRYRGEEISLLSEKEILPGRTMILSGTPEGVIFQGIPISIKIKGLFSLVTGGWGIPISQNVIDCYIKDAKKNKAYLQPGDVVTIYSQALGVIQSRVVYR